MPRSRYPRKNCALVPGDVCSIAFMASLYRSCVFPATSGHSSTT